MYPAFKTSESRIWRHFYDVIKVTSPKMRHQNDAKIFQFSSSPPLSKILVARTDRRVSQRGQWERV